MVVWKEERVLFGASQFQPPSGSCSLRRRRARLSVGRPKYAPSARTPPLMHGSTSPAKKGFPPVSAGRSSQLGRLLQRRLVSSREIADSTDGSLGSTPVVR